MLKSIPICPAVRKSISLSITFFLCLSVVCLFSTNFLLLHFFPLVPFFSVAFRSILWKYSILFLVEGPFRHHPKYTVLLNTAISGSNFFYFLSCLQNHEQNMTKTLSDKLFFLFLKAFSGIPI